MPPWLEVNLEFESIHNRQLLDAISLLNTIKLLKIGFMAKKGREQQRTSVIVEMAVSKAQRVLGTPRAYFAPQLEIKLRTSENCASATTLLSCHVASRGLGSSVSLVVSFCFKMLRLLNLECSMAERRSFRFRLRG